MNVAQSVLQDENTMQSGHPLEIIPFFRRYPCSWWRDLIYTFIWNTGLALIITGFIAIFAQEADLRRWLWANWLVSNWIGYSIHLGYEFAFRIARDWMRGKSLAARAIRFFAIPLAGVFFGYWLGLEILNKHSVREWVFSPQGLLYVTVLSLIVSGMLAGAFISRERSARLESAYLREQARAILSDKAAADARLRMLQAQIEPHFLFNTLANAVSLIDPAPGKAKRMLEDFIDYLRATLSATRAERLTLREEVDMIQAYLRLIELRMADRLQYRVDIPAALLELPFPPMLLQPIVENAIRHGLEPKIEGGRVDIIGRIEAGKLQITVTDNGLGPGTAIREGVGISNVCERLQALYRDEAAFQMERTAAGGTRVTMTLPCEANRS